MMNPPDAILILSFSQEEAKNLADLARALGYPDAKISVGTIADAIKTMDARTERVDYIILDIGTRGKDVLSELDELALHCDASVEVMVIGSINDITFYRELKNRGILEYFPRPAQAGDIKGVMQQASALKQQQKDLNTSQG